LKLLIGGNWNRADAALQHGVSESLAALPVVDRGRREHHNAKVCAKLDYQLAAFIFRQIGLGNAVAGIRPNENMKAAPRQLNVERGGQFGISLGKCRQESFAKLAAFKVENDKAVSRCAANAEHGLLLNAKRDFVVCRPAVAVENPPVLYDRVFSIDAAAGWNHRDAKLALPWRDVGNRCDCAVD